MGRHKLNNGSGISSRILPQCPSDRFADKELTILRVAHAVREQPLDIGSVLIAKLMDDRCAANPEIPICAPRVHLRG